MRTCGLPRIAASFSLWVVICQVRSLQCSQLMTQHGLQQITADGKGQQLELAFM